MTLQSYVLFGLAKCYIPPQDQQRFDSVGGFYYLLTNQQKTEADMKLSIIVEEIVATVTMGACEFTFDYDYFIIYKAGTKQSVKIAVIDPEKVRFMNIEKGLTPWQMTKIHRLWKLIDWTMVRGLKEYIGCTLDHYTVSTEVLDRINKAKEAFTETGLIEWKQFASLKEDYDY